MDGGPSIALGPNFHPRLSDRLVEAAKAIELPHQMEPIPAQSGTDAWPIQVSRAGVPCALVGIPVKFMHSPVETVCLRDVERAGRLLAGLNGFATSRNFASFPRRRSSFAALRSIS